MKRRHFLKTSLLFPVGAGMMTLPVLADTRTDLFRAVQIDNAGTVKKLLEKGVDPNMLNEKGECALSMALKDEATKVADLLIADERTEVNFVNKNGETPLMFAALKGLLPQAQALIDRGALINKDGWTPLHYAACYPDPKMMAFLLENGADINSRSPNNTTPLMMAAGYGSVKNVNFLLEKGADMTLRNQQRMTAYDFAMRSERPDVAKLLKKGAAAK